MKKLLSILGILISLSTFAQDFQYTYNGETITYSILDFRDRTCKIKDYAHMDSQMLGELVLPDSVLYNDYWFTLRSIGVMSFANCTELTSIEIPNTVETIEQSAFRGCNFVRSLQIGNSVKTIDNGAFYGCSGLIALEIPNNVITIGDHAFYGCNGLHSLLIGNSVSTLGERAFGDCDSHLIKYAYPSYMQKDPVPKGYFSNPYGVKYDYWRSIVENGCVYGQNKESIYFASITLEDDYKIPNTIKTIGKNAFRGCTALTSVEIPNSVETIDDYAFYHCYGIESLKIGNSVKTIGKYAFSFCTDLTSVEIPNSVEIIRDNAFHTCTQLASALIGASVKNMGSTVFGMTRIIKCAYPNTISYPFDESGAKYVICYDPEGTIIDNGWIYGPNKESIYYAPHTIKGDCIIPSTVTSIGDDAFSGCAEITSVEIPNSLHTIGNYAFFDCTGIKSLLIGNSVKTIGRGAFSCCSALTSLEIPDSVETIGDIAGHDEEDEYWPFFSDELKIKNMGAFSNCSALTSVEIPNSVHTIGNCAFSNCTGLKSLVLGNAVKTIGMGAFSNCSALTSLEIPNSVETIGILTIHEDSELNDHMIATLMYLIDIGAFSNCSSLTSVKIPNSVETIGFYTFSNCIGLTSLLIGNSVKEIGTGAFSSCSALSSVEIPNSVETIGHIAFQDCDELNSLLLGNSVKTIGIGAFRNCPALSAIEIPNSVEAINEYSFAGCSSLVCIDCKALIPPSAYENSFDEASYQSCLLKVPGTSEEKYRQNPVWGKFSIESSKIPITSIQLSQNMWEGEIGSAFQLAATITPENATNKSLIWTSSDTSVATVDDNGYVEAVGVGTAVIIVYSSDGSEAYDNCTVTVRNLPITEITLSKSELDIFKGYMFPLYAKVTPESASNKFLVWTSSDESVATVNQWGYVAGVNAGTALISATDTNGSGVSASCLVTVKNIPIITLNKSEAEVFIGETIQLYAVETPENSFTKSYVWSSSDDSVATVNGDGDVTGVKAGTTGITATVTYDDYGLSFSASCTVSVKDPDASIDMVNGSNVFVRSGASQIIITGVQDGHLVKIYDTMGKSCYSALGSSEEVRINVISGQVYIVKIDNKVFKILVP